MTADQSKLRVFIVENEPLLRLFTEQMLLDLGHAVVGWASTVQAAIAGAEHLRPDLILMDVNLDGGGDGTQAACEIRDRFGIASLFMTGCVDDATCQRAMRSAPVGYLRKPFDISHMENALQGYFPPKNRASASPRPASRARRSRAASLKASVTVTSC